MIRKVAAIFSLVGLSICGLLLVDDFRIQVVYHNYRAEFFIKNFLYWLLFLSSNIIVSSVSIYQENLKIRISIILIFFVLTSSILFFYAPYTPRYYTIIGIEWLHVKKLNFIVVSGLFSVLLGYLCDRQINTTIMKIFVRTKSIPKHIRSIPKYIRIIRRYDFRDH